MVVLALVRIGHCQPKGLWQGKSEMDIKGRPWRISSTNPKQRVEGATESRESRQDQKKYKGQWIAKTAKLVVVVLGRGPTMARKAHGNGSIDGVVRGGAWRVGAADGGGATVVDRTRLMVDSVRGAENGARQW
ncbi:hypothetical protein U1Q18_030284 [Sarracenia purpurea var. burkii]